MIRKIRIRNFRSLKNVEISLEDKLTVLVGENDTGKTSIIDALKIVFEGKNPEVDDFHWGTDEISIEVELNDRYFVKQFLKNDDNSIESKSMIKIKKEALDRFQNEADSIDLDNLKNNNENGEIYKRLRDLASTLCIKIRSNSKIDTIKDKIINKIKEYKNVGFIECNIPTYNIYFLDGKHFESISKFFQEIFFKEKSKNIWNEEVEEGRSIKDIIKEKLDIYAENLKSEIENKGIKDKIKAFLPELQEISINPVFEPSSIKIGIEVQLLETGGKKIRVDKKGDGTKRRITMALLEYKRSQDKEPSLYVFDEPDTHLHVKAQVDLLNIIRKFNENGKQVIIVTHSPFIMNAVRPQEIRLLLLQNGETIVKSLSLEKDIEWALKRLGIENVILFFSRKILIVEGKTEEVFIPLMYEKLFNTSLYSDLVKVVKREGITDVPRFAKVLSEFIKPKDIFILIDNDADERTRDIINTLQIPEENIFKIGNKEFEDAFEPEVIYEAWKIFTETRGKKIGPSWTIKNIRELRDKCVKDGLKFSEKLKELNKKGSMRMDKPTFAQALAEYCNKEHLPEQFIDLLNKLRY